MQNKFKVFTKARLCAMMLFLLSALGINAQNVAITGSVVDQTGEPIIGATILEKGTTNAAVTNVDGKFRLNVSPKGKTIVATFMGMLPKEVTIGSERVFNITMEEAMTSLNDVVVVGYGTVRKKDLTGTVTSITSKDIQNLPTGNVAQAMAGRMAGVQVTSTDGSPDAEMVIRVRGGNSVTGSNSPLYIVDGFPVSSLSDISPTDIENISVLKDASSTAIYGAQGANGVILITTKSAEAGKTKVSYNSFLQSKTIANRLSVLDSYEYVLLNYEYAAIKGEDSDDMSAFIADFGVYEDLDLYKYQEGTNWQDNMFGSNVLSQQHNISVVGGNEKTKFALTGTYNYDGGLLINNDYTRMNLNFKLNHDISKTLKMDFNMRLSNTEVNGSGTSGDTYKIRSTQALTKGPVNGLEDQTVVNLNGLTDEELSAYYEAHMTLAEQSAEYWKKKTTNVFNFTGALTWNAFKGFSARLEGGYDFSFGNTKNYWGSTTSNSTQNGSSLPLVDWTKVNGGKYRVANTYTYRVKPTSDMSMDIMLGQEYMKTVSEQNYIMAKFFSKDLSPEKIFANLALSTGTGNLTVSSKVSTPIVRASYFGRMNWSFLDKYLATATLRADGSSKFAPGNQWGYFPAASVAWRIKEESFMYDLDYISNLKLRFSYGESGNDDIASTQWKLDYAITSGSSNSTGKPYGADETANSFYIATNTTLPNPSLKWETTSTKNIGLDFGFFKDAINGTLDVYKNVTRDLLIISAISAPGYTTQQKNIGQTSGRGVELTLNGKLINKKDFSLDFNFNIGFNRTNVDALADGLTEQSYSSGWAGTDMKGSDDYRVYVGQPVGIIYGFVTEGYYTTDDFSGYNAATKTYTLNSGVATPGSMLGGAIGVRPGTIKLKDISGPNGVPDGSIDATYDRTVIGNTNPDHTGGFGFSMVCKDLDFSVLFNWVYGNDIYNANKIASTQNYRTSYTNLLSIMSSSNRYTYLDDNGALVTDLDQLKAMNETGENTKTMWSPYSFGSATVICHSWAIEDGSYLRLQNITAGYTLPQDISNRIGISRLRAYCTLNNVFCWTKYTGFDPEVSTLIRNSSYTGLTPGVDYSSYPKSFSTTVGLNITF
jgi:TonB-dependent starch-binding outer membrane protein SusC